MWIKNGVITRIQLNEACSAGCGSFIENFAESLNMPIGEFVNAALDAESRRLWHALHRVHELQSQTGAERRGFRGDIAAGLCYSVIRNACYKVMKLTSVEELGEFVVAQGGAFANDALLRALELELGHPVMRPASPG